MKQLRNSLLGALLDGDAVRNRSICFAYHGSATEASSDRNPPVCLVPNQPTINTYGSVLSPSTAQSTAGYVGGTALWRYTSSDSATIASSPGYFTDGLARGMRTGDAMIYVHQSSYGTSPDISFGVLGTSNSSAGFNMVPGGVIQSS